VPHPDIIVVPGGPGQNNQMQDGPLHDWLRSADQTSTWTTSVCTGSLILAAAGLLSGRRATSHWMALDELGRLGTTPVSERVVVDGKYVTAAGVSAGIDMALALAGRIAGDQVAQAIQLQRDKCPYRGHIDGGVLRLPGRFRAVGRIRGPRMHRILPEAPILPEKSPMHSNKRDQTCLRCRSRAMGGMAPQLGRVGQRVVLPFRCTQQDRTGA